MIHLLLPLLLLVSSLTGEIQAGELPGDSETRSRLSQLLIAAIRYDVFNGRCRGFVSSQHADNVETLTIGKFGMTLAQLSDELAARRLPILVREVRDRVVKEILDLGGCRRAKQLGYLERLRTEYQRLYRWLSDYP
ncbi:MAG TPA: hypothetical protein ENI96_04140 [Sedimenticola thiotaurini]|uniref:Uncharacterized protein n=1 Tax=Sedimenticola thiotaurini TaxID=1543721 RepID=A0A831RJI4_9GAMM|nr:hypothetical protein [Sedimenticola thiotaurini]